MMSEIIMENAFSPAKEILHNLNVAKTPSAWGTTGTIRPYQNFHPDHDAAELYNSIKTKDKNPIIRILTNRTSEQRQQILMVYNSASVELDLLTSLRSLLTGNLGDLILALMMTPAQLDAQELRSAMKGIGTDEDTLIEILCSQNSSELQEITTAYKKEFNRTLEQDITDDTSKDFQKLLLALVQGNRAVHSGVIDYNLIDEDVKALRKIDTNTKKPDTDVWIHIFTARSTDHLERVFQQYKECSNQDIEATIKKLYTGDLRKCLTALVCAIQNTPLYLAEIVHNSLKGLGKKDKSLIRIMVSHSERDLLSIRAEFRKKYGKSLYSSIEEATDGPYQTALLSICSAEDV
ncbi:annexin A2-like [Erpetoichthys calabaricus]|uniref:Annexin A2-like n=1 Tax=Erpetoichthys calabaricus TaxID=27687 RepID=A0A8C4S1J7_ERPCA|nr:annexin A2-like [Erpetoichthys calabaricus]